MPKSRFLPQADLKRPHTTIKKTSLVYFSQKELGLIEEEIREIAESDAYDFYYDIAKDTYYCRVMTISSAEDNCRSAFFTLYPI